MQASEPPADDASISIGTVFKDGACAPSLKGTRSDLPLPASSLPFSTASPSAQAVEHLHYDAIP